MDARDATSANFHLHKGRRQPHFSWGVEPSVPIRHEAITAYAGAVPMRCEAIIAYASMVAIRKACGIDFSVSSPCVETPKSVT